MPPLLEPPKGESLPRPPAENPNADPETNPTRTSSLEKALATCACGAAASRCAEPPPQRKPTRGHINSATFSCAEAAPPLSALDAVPSHYPQRGGIHNISGTTRESTAKAIVGQCRLESRNFLSETKNSPKEAPHRVRTSNNCSERHRARPSPRDRARVRCFATARSRAGAGTSAPSGFQGVSPTLGRPAAHDGNTSNAALPNGRTTSERLQRTKYNILPACCGAAATTL